MENGRYSVNKTDFSKLTCAKVKLTIWNENIYGRFGCGASAIGLLTGISPVKISIEHPADHYSDKYIVDKLKKHGFKVYSVTKCDVTKESYIQFPIKNNHLLLISQLMAKRTATWSVIYNLIQYHNFQQSRILELDFLNWPLLSCFCIFKSAWH